jgi:hypothetical protein
VSVSRNTLPSLPGDGVRKFRSVSEVLRSMPGLGLPVAEPLPSLLWMRFVCTLPTSVGECGLFFRAAAAAAADNDEFDFWLLRKASVAAEEAAPDTAGGPPVCLAWTYIDSY